MMVVAADKVDAEEATETHIDGDEEDSAESCNWILISDERARGW